MAANSGKPLKIGSSGAAVADVQRVLHQKVTWYYDQATANAVRRFQRAHKLSVNGVVGKATARALHVRLRQSRYPSTGGVQAVLSSTGSSVKLPAELRKIAQCGRAVTLVLSRAAGTGTSSTAPRGARSAVTGIPPRRPRKCRTGSRSSCTGPGARRPGPTAGSRQSQSAADGPAPHVGFAHLPIGFETEERDGAVRIALSGELDVATARSVEERLTALEAGELPAHVILDLRGLRFIDSTGLSLLINADKRGRKAGRRVTIVAGTGPPRRILDTTGLRGRLDIVDEPPG